MGKHTLNEQVTHRFAGLMRIGESRHAAKEACGASHDFGKTVDGVFSIQTRHTYEAACYRFTDWCQEHESVGHRAALDSLRQYVPDYLAARDADASISAATVRTERAALGKMYGERIEYDVQTAAEVTRSRHAVANDAHFSEDNNADLVAVCRATGGRRDDIARLTPSDFHEDDGGAAVRAVL